MRNLMGVPIPETVADLKALNTGDLRSHFERLNPFVRNHVMGELRRELAHVEEVAAQKGQTAARTALIDRLAGYGFRVEAGEEETAYTLALRWLRTLLR